MEEIRASVWPWTPTSLIYFYSLFARRPSDLTGRRFAFAVVDARCTAMCRSSRTRSGLSPSHAVYGARRAEIASRRSRHVTTSRRRAERSNELNVRRCLLERGMSGGMRRARTRRSLSSVELAPLFSKQKQLSGRR